MTLLMEALQWLGNPTHWQEASGIPTRITQHLLLTIGVVLAASLVALPVGVLIGHLSRGAGVIGAVTGAARAIPTLGVLTLFGLALGVGLRAPVLALMILAIPSLLAGAYSGVQNIDPAIPAAARAIGMTRAQVILTVEIPLALPVIIGGMRAATLQVLSTATLAAYTADVGLGRFLFSGLKARDYPQMLGGALIVLALALLVELVLAATQRAAKTRLITPTAKNIVLTT